MISSVPLIFLYYVTDVVGKAVGKVRILGKFQIGDGEMAKVSPSLLNGISARIHFVAVNL